mmetsp:Transcript_173880/g.557320  ORF Transcript_173880/g.557320 Transcript_173880/m.557320 type:complete len:394 (+) Transcript_173880:1079-2260(+)
MGRCRWHHRRAVVRGHHRGAVVRGHAAARGGRGGIVRSASGGSCRWHATRGRGDACAHTEAGVPPRGIHAPRGIGSGAILALHQDLTAVQAAHGAELAQALVLQHVVEPRIAEGRLGQLQIVVEAEEALHVGERDGARMATHGVAVEDVQDALPDVLPCRHAQLRRHFAPKVHRLAARRALLLDVVLRVVEGHDAPVEVAQDLPLREAELDDVADLAQCHALQEGQSPLDQGLGASVAAAWEPLLVSLQASEVDLRPRPHLRAIGVHGTAQVDEHLGRTNQGHGILFAIFWLHAQFLARLADLAKVLRVNQRHGVQGRCDLVVALRALVRRRRGMEHLAKPLQNNTPERLQLIDVQALDRDDHLNVIWARELLVQRGGLPLLQPRTQGHGCDR